MEEDDVDEEVEEEAEDEVVDSEESTVIPLVLFFAVS